MIQITLMTMNNLYNVGAYSEDVERLAIATRNGEAALRLRLGEYHNIGDGWVQIYRTKMQPGELISLADTLKMYND